MARRGERKMFSQLERISALVEQGELSPPAALASLRQANAPAAAVGGAAPNPLLEKALAQLDGLVGLREVKQLVYEIKAFIEIQQKRAREGLATEPLTLHMIFKGNPLNTPVKPSTSTLQIGSGKVECPGFFYP